MADLIDRNALSYELSGWDWQDLYLPVHFQTLIDDAPAVNRWIPCCERMPENGQRVLIYSRSGRFFDVTYHVHEHIPYRCFQINKMFGKTYAWDESDVTHWMPLPEPPEGD